MVDGFLFGGLCLCVSDELMINVYHVNPKGKGGRVEWRSVGEGTKIGWFESK